MEGIVQCTVEEAVVRIRMDDGKANAMSPRMLEALNGALDVAATETKPVVLVGRPGMFSAGFDLQVLLGGGPAAIGMLRGGFELASRLAAHPTPVVAACTGHAIAMGAFLLLSVDYRIGAGGAFRICANEVAIGLTMPFAAAEILRHRLSPAAFQRAAMLAEEFDPDAAVEVGFLDRVVDATELEAQAVAFAASLRRLDRAAHAASKLRLREGMLRAVRSGLDIDFPLASTATA